MILSLVATVIGLGAFCALFYRLAVYAFPILAALAAGQGAYGLGAGIWGSLILGVLAGFMALILGTVLFSASRSVSFRLIMAFVFALPATYAGYLLGLSLLRIGAIDGFWLQALAATGAVAAGATAVLRLIDPEFALSRNQAA